MFIAYAAHDQPRLRITHRHWLFANSIDVFFETFENLCSAKPPPQCAPASKKYPPIALLYNRRKLLAQAYAIPSKGWKSLSAIDILIVQRRLFAMVQMQTVLRAVGNSGAKFVRCINVLRRQWQRASGNVGSLIVASVIETDTSVRTKKEAKVKFIAHSS